MNLLREMPVYLIPGDHSWTVGTRFAEIELDESSMTAEHWWGRTSGQETTRGH